MLLKGLKRISFYHAMHYSAKHCIAIACHLSVRPSVCLSVTLVDQEHIGWQSRKLIAWTISTTSSLFKGHPPMPRGNFGETRGGVGKSGMLEHKSGNISEMCKDRGKVTMGSL